MQDSRTWQTQDISKHRERTPDRSLGSLGRLLEVMCQQRPENNAEMNQRERLDWRVQEECARQKGQHILRSDRKSAVHGSYFRMAQRWGLCRAVEAVSRGGLGSHRGS